MAHGGCQLAAREGRILIDGQPVETQWHPCFQCWVFVCPAAGHPCHKLYEVGGRWACFRCHGLEHASRHGAVGAMPALRKLTALRRKLGADLRPFSGLPLAPIFRPYRYWRVVRQIRELEAGLLLDLRRDVSDVLERAYERR